MSFTIKSLPGPQGGGTARLSIKSLPEAVPYGPGREAIQGLTFGFGDEIEAGIKAMLGRGTYDENWRAINQSRDTYVEENPGEAMAANFAGSLVMPGGLVAKAAHKATSAIRAAGVTAAGGAATGAVTGAGSAGPDESRLGGAGEGAVLGAVGAGLGAAAGRVTGAGINAVQRRRNAGVLPDDKAGAAYLARLKAGGKSLADVQQGLTDGDMLAEVSGRPVEGLAGAVVRRSPEAHGRAAGIIEERRGARAGDLLRQVQMEATGDSGSTMSQIRKLADEGKKRTSSRYEFAFRKARPIQSARIDQLMGLPPFQAAYARAQRIAQLDGKQIPDFQPGQAMELRTLDYVKKGLDDLIYGAKRDPQSSLGREELRLVDGLRRELVEQIDQHAPKDYRIARQTYAGEVRMVEAAEAGRDAWKKGPEYVADFLGNPAVSQSEKEAFRSGANAAFMDMSSKRRDSQELFRAMDSRHVQSVMQALAGDRLQGPSAVPAMVAKQKAQADFATRLTGGSATQARSAEDDLLGGSFADVMATAQQVGDGRLVEALRRIYDVNLAGTDKTRGALSGLLFNTDLAQNQRSLERLRRLDEMLLDRQALSRASTGAGAGAGSATLSSGD